MPALKYDIFGLVAAAAWPAPSSPSLLMILRLIFLLQRSAHFRQSQRNPKRNLSMQHNYQDSPPLSVQPASHLPENLEPRESTFDFGSWEGVFEDTMSTPLVFYCFFNIHFCCIRVHSIIGLRPQTTWSYINHALRDACSALC